MRQGLLAGILLVAVATSTTGAQGKTDPKLNEIAAAFAAAFNEKDAVKITSFYTDDAVVMPPNQPAVTGRGNIESYYRSGFARSAGTMRVKPTESTIAGTTAFEAGVSSMTAGSPPTTETGKYLVIYKRVGNDWKIAYDIFNDD